MLHLVSRVTQRFLKNFQPIANSICLIFNWNLILFARNETSIKQYSDEYVWIGLAKRLYKRVYSCSRKNLLVPWNLSEQDLTVLWGISVSHSFQPNWMKFMRFCKYFFSFFKCRQPLLLSFFRFEAISNQSWWWWKD